jgi:hypothetical protein
MQDEFRVRAHTREAQRLYGALEALDRGRDEHGPLPRAVVTHDPDDVFVYVESLPDAERVRAVVREALAHERIEAELQTARWHHLEERWEDAAEPLPATDAERATDRRSMGSPIGQHARLEAQETAESERYHLREWEVRVTLATHHDARAFAERLRSEGIPVNQRWRHLLVGAEDEDDAAALAERLRAEAPAGSEIHSEGNGQPFWEMLHPFSYLGGIAN